MLRLLVTPKWLALTLFLVLLVALFSWLGVWQWSRAITTFEAPSTSAPASYQPLRDVHQQGVPVPESAIGLPVQLRGEYVFSDELYVPGRLQADGLGERVGYWVLTPLEIAPGEVIPVVRGWVADSAASSPSPSGEVTVKGLLQATESDALREGVSDELRDDEIAVVSSPELLSRWEGELWQGFVVLQSQQPTAPQGALEPVAEPPPTERSVSWQSLAYAVQWWLFAVFVVFFYWRMLSLEYETTTGSASGPSEGKV